MKRRYRYGKGSVAAQYARGAGGFAAAAGALLLLKPAAAVAWILAGAAALFLVYFARAVVRHLTQIELDETGVSARGPLGAAIRWDELRALRLKYYATRSDRSGGWMELDLRGASRRIAVDSDLVGFDDLARAAAAEAMRRGARLDEGTQANLAVIGGRAADA